MQASRSQTRNAAPLLIASSHTLTGVMPGQVARHSFAERVAATAGTGFDALCIHWRDHARLVAEGADPGAMRAMVENAGLLVPEVEFVSDWHPWNDTGVDLIELNEAFASQALAVIRALGLDESLVNVNGGAIALGHPLGCTGAKLTVQMMHEMPRRDAQFGMVTMCIGGGMGAAGIFERLN